MSYLLDKKIFFSEAAGIIRNLDSDEMQTLSVTAAMIFSLLIEQQGYTLSKEDIAGYIENKFNYKVAHNTITQYISVVRKSLVLMGFSATAIVTVPKTGFYFSNEIVAEQVDGMSSAPLSQSGTLAASGQKIFTYRHVVKLAGLSLLAAMAVAIGCFQYQKESYSLERDIEPVNIGQIGKCPLYALIKESGSELANAYIIPAAKVAQAKLPCIKDHIFFFQPDSLVAQGYPGNAYLARCLLSSTDGHQQYGQCENVYLFGDYHS